MTKFFEITSKFLRLTIQIRHINFIAYFPKNILISIFIINRFF